MMINQKTGQIRLALDVIKMGEAWIDYMQGIMLLAEDDLSERLSKNDSLLELILSDGNIEQAMNQVIKNKGSAGIDGMKTKELRKYMKKNWQKIKTQILEEKYKPQAVKQLEIPKSNGKKRKLGIPTVIDRTIQQAINQILQKIWEARFSDNSYGFRPKRSAHQAIKKLKQQVAEGYNWCVDIDLKDFFNEVNHDKLMYRMSEQIKDKRVLKLIRKYLQSGILANGMVSSPDKGTPQGSPLSPLLSNIVLNELDQELELRGHKFVRYADDFRLQVKSERAGKRVMESITKYLEEELKLKVNNEKSQIVEGSKINFLGYRILKRKEGPRLGLSQMSHLKLKSKIRYLTRKMRYRSLANAIKDLNSYLKGWQGYFGYIETPSVLKKYNGWIRRRLRALVWRKWENGRNRFYQLCKLGVSKGIARAAATSKNQGPEHVSTSMGINMGLNNEYFEDLGLYELIPRLTC
jgi:RNA-directed DNA polymerase